MTELTVPAEMLTHCCRVAVFIQEATGLAFVRLDYYMSHRELCVSLDVKSEYYQNCFVLDCVTQCSQSAAHLYEQFLQVRRIGLVTLGLLCCA